MLVVIKHPYVMKASRKKELHEQYTKQLNNKNAVLIVEPGTKVLVYEKSDDELIEVKVMSGIDVTNE